jgi:acetyl esterase/lipase
MQLLALRGYAVASLDYRLMREPGTGTFPAPAHDVRSGVRWLRANAFELDIDPDRIVAIGFSAGALLAGLLATAPDALALDEGEAASPISPHVSGAVMFFGPSELRPGLRVGRGAEGTVRRFLGAAPDRAPEIAALASPAAHVDRGDPPMLLVHDDGDPIVDVEQSRHMVRTLGAHGVTAVYVELKGRSHGYGLFPPGSYREPATCTTLEFLRRTIGPF